MNNSISIISSIIILLFPYIGKHWFNRQVLASTVVSLGLLGTFGGIFYGLSDFNVNDIESSLPQLLEGMKTAFLTSIAGMLSSLILKLSPALYGIKAQKENTAKEQEETTKLFELLSGIEKNTAKLSEFPLQKPSSASHSDELLETLRHIHLFMQEVQQNQKKNSEETTQVLKELQSILRDFSQNNHQLETYLHKSFSMNVSQQEQMALQMNNLGNMVKTTGTQFESQLTLMEEKFTQKLSETEQFTKTLMAIIKKLTQDHLTLHKS